MALPTTITTGGDVTVGCGGPFLSSSGNVYVIVRDDVTTSKLRAFKATDPTISFSNVGTDPQVTSGNTIICFDAVQSGDNIHVITHDAGAVTTNQIRYHVFSMSSDSWTTTNEAVKGANFSTFSSVNAIKIKLRSDNDVIVLYNGPRVANMGSDRERVYYARKESTVWTVDIAVDNGGATHWYVIEMLDGNSDRKHFLIIDSGVNDAYQRRLNSDNTMQTFPSSYDTVAYSGTQQGTSYDNAGTQKCRFANRDGSVAADVELAGFDSTDTPSITVNADITGAVAGRNIEHSHSLSSNATTLWHTFITDFPDYDIYTQSNANDAGWDTPTLFYNGAVSSIYTNIYTRGFDTVLAMVFMETDPTYHEKVLQVGDTAINFPTFDMDFGRPMRRR